MKAANPPCQVLSSTRRAVHPVTTHAYQVLAFSCSTPTNLHVLHLLTLQSVHILVPDLRQIGFDMRF